MASRGLRILGHNLSTALRTHRAPLRTCPQLMCTAAQQPNNPESEEEKGKKRGEESTEQLSAEKAKLEDQVKEVTALRDVLGAPTNQKRFQGSQQDKYKRALADTENLRQRSQKMLEDAKLYGIQGFCKDLLEVADILEKATQSVPKEEIKDQNPHLKNLYEGLVMTQVQMQKVFTKHGIVKLNPVGAKFDPYEHEALFHSPVEGKEPGTVALVTKVGYKLHERTLRPALVGVVKGT